MGHVGQFFLDMGFVVEAECSYDLFCWHFFHCADPLDYIGGTFDVTFGAAAGDTQCINIILVSDSERESLEDFFVDVDLNDMGPVRAGNPSRTIVGIEGIYV